MFDFFKFFMPAINNDLESAKYHADRENYEQAHQCLDAMENKLDKAKQQVKKEIKKRDS